MSEFLALMRFDVLGTSISPFDITDAQQRMESLMAKQLYVKLEFRATPMESVDQAVCDRIPFDVVIVCTALHHAYDWRQAIQSACHCLKPGGWFIIAQEPNLLHTLISYRVAKLVHTHEIGLSRRDLIRQLEQTGFTKIIILRNHVDFYIRNHWIAAQQ